MASVGARYTNRAATPFACIHCHTKVSRVWLDCHKRFVYDYAVIRSFADAETERFFVTGRTRRLPRDIAQRAMMRLLELNAAARLWDLRFAPSDRLGEFAGGGARSKPGSGNRPW